MLFRLGWEERALSGALPVLPVLNMLVGPWLLAGCARQPPLLPPRTKFRTKEGICILTDNELPEGGKIN